MNYSRDTMVPTRFGVNRGSMPTSRSVLSSVPLMSQNAVNRSYTFLLIVIQRDYGH